MRDDRGPRAAGRRVAALALGVGSLIVAAGCASEPSPAEQRDDDVRTRLETSFSGTQVDCIMGELSTATKEALITTDELPADSEALDDYSAALSQCVVGGTTTSAPAGDATTPESTTTSEG